jgi:photosystem II stability/assembly factor-like uncharacterized protein
MLALRRFLSSAPLLFFALFAPGAAAADLAGSLLALGPDGGTIDALAVDPLDPLTVYAGAPDSGGGVFKTSDGGQTWEPMRNGMPLGSSVLSLAIDPSRHATLYAGTFGGGIYKSTDGGVSWTPRNQGVNVDNQIFALAVTPGSPDTVLAGSERGVYRSVNGGATWVLANQGLPSPPAPEGPFVRALVASTTRAYATVVSNGVFRSVDGGATWSAVNRGLPAGADIVELAISQQNGALFAATLHAVFRSLDGGAHWTAASAGLASSLVIHALAVDPGSPARVFAATDQGVFRSENRGAAWTASSTGLTNHDVLALAVHPSGTLYAGTASISPNQVSSGGVFQSSDGGHTWQRRSQGISTLFVTDLAVEPTAPTTLWAILSIGLFRSGDGGSSWSQVDPGLPVPYLSMVVDPDRPGTVYLIGSSSSGSVLRVTNDSGASWRSLPNPGIVFFANLAIDPRTHSLFLSGQPGVFRSADGGQTWTAAAGEIAGDIIHRITPDPATPWVLYAAGQKPAGPHLFPPPQARVYKSTDGGVTWLRSDAGLENVTNLDQILVSPAAPATLYGRGDFSIFRSRDAGATWELAIQTLPAAPQDLVAAADGTLFVATQGAGVLTSTDGQTWTPIDGVPAFNAVTLRFDPHNPRLLYVGTGGTGVQAIALATPSVCDAGPTALCLQGHRFQVEVTWRDFEGRTGAGQTLPGSDQTGSFWFFDPGNTELAVKVLDGRLLNNHFWVFYASLTNVAYTLTVTDTATGAVRLYKNPLGHFGSAGDTEAF